MTKKRKISVRKVMQALVTLVVTVGCIVAVLGASEKQQTKTLRKVNLSIRNEHKYPFLDKQALWNDLVIQKGIEEGVSPISSLDVKSVEQQAYKNPWVASAQVYVDNSREINIYITQRVPVARIFYESGQSFYIDQSLNLLPLSDQFTYYTTIVTNVPVLKNDSLNRDMKAQIVKMVKFVERDTFWSSQIAQISITPDRKFELTPVLGTQRILFGDTTRMEEKFGNLFAFYKNVLNRIGWDKYETLDLRYRDQVIATPSLPMKLPTKNALSNMDWVKSIMAASPRDSGVSLVRTTAPVAVTTPAVPTPAAVRQPAAAAIVKTIKSAPERKVEAAPKVIIPVKRVEPAKKVEVKTVPRKPEAKKVEVKKPDAKKVEVKKMPAVKTAITKPAPNAATSVKAKTTKTTTPAKKEAPAKTDKKTEKKKQEKEQDKSNTQHKPKYIYQGSEKH